MKRLILGILSFCMGTFAFAQSPTAPKAAKDDLKTRFPKATNAKWEVGRNGSEAEWKENGKEVVAVYDAQGKFIMTERELDKAALPAPVAKGIEKAFPNAVVREAESQTHANKVVTYEVELTQDGVGREVTLDAQGKLLNDGAHGTDEGTEGSDGSDEGNDGSDNDD